MGGDSLTDKSGSARHAWINRVLADRYEILEALGEGELFWTFRARDRQANRIVALKLLRSDLDGAEAVVARLRPGLEAALALRHDAIVRVHTVESDPESGCPLFIVEDFVRGIDLKERIRRAAPFPSNVVVDAAVAIAEGLEYAHGRGVAHGGLHGESVLIPSDAPARLTGFGLAWGESAQSDLAALGDLLHEMLTGERPRADSLDSPRAINQAVPRALEGIVLKARSQEPSVAYRSASELLVDLRAVQDALRYGRSLSWSPLEPPAEEPTVMPVGAKPAPTASAKPPAPEPEAKKRRVSRPHSPAAARAVGPVMPVTGEESNVPQPRQRPGIGRWFVTFNLLLLAAIIALVIYAAGMIMKIMVPPGEVVVPNLVGKPYEEAESLGKRQGFEVVKIDHTNRPDIPAGVIYRQKEMPGMRIREGQKIAVEVSDGPVMVYVPSVTDMTLEKAKKLLERDGLRRGDVEGRYDIQPKGIIIDQDPPQGERRPKGAKVNLVVSKGEEPTPEPTVEPTVEPTPEPPDEAPPGSNTSPPDDTDDPASSTRKFTVPATPYLVPADGQSHRIRIDVIDGSGTRTEYDNSHASGERVQVSVIVSGPRVTFRLYDNGELKGQATL